LRDQNGLSNSSNGLSKYSDLRSHQWRTVSQIPPTGLLKFPCGHQSETLKKPWLAIIINIYIIIAVLLRMIHCSLHFSVVSL